MYISYKYIIDIKEQVVNGIKKFFFQPLVGIRPFSSKYPSIVRPQGLCYDKHVAAKNNKRRVESMEDRNINELRLGEQLAFLRREKQIT